MSSIWDDIFGNMDSFQKRIEEMFNNLNDPNVKTYGYTMYKGPDGEPHVHEFGSGVGVGSVPADGVREPLTDITVDGDVVSIVIELPGVDKEDIQLEGTDSTMTVTVDTEKRKFKKTVPIPVPVDPDSAKAEYNNGILEVTLASKDKPKEGRKIPIA